MAVLDGSAAVFLVLLADVFTLLLAHLQLVGLHELLEDAGHVGGICALDRDILQGVLFYPS